MTLNELKPGAQARIAAVRSTNPDLEARLREVGFAEGDEIELLARGPFGGQPLAVRLNRRILALRGAEAAAVSLEAP
ncbi:MAG: FeoA family protein [Alphaproteobacteria bacterium]